MFVHEVRANQNDRDEALRVAPEYFARSSRGSVRYAAGGPVAPADEQRVHGLVGRSFTGCFSWVTMGQAKALEDRLENAVDIDELCVEVRPQRAVFESPLTARGASWLRISAARS